MSLKDFLDSQEFYDSMQNYRICPISQQARVSQYFEEVKKGVLNAALDLSIADTKAVIDVAKAAVDKLSNNHSIDLPSFTYGFLLGRGCSDEIACYVSDSFN